MIKIKNALFILYVHHLWWDGYFVNRHGLCHAAHAIPHDTFYCLNSQPMGKMSACCYIENFAKNATCLIYFTRSKCFCFEMMQFDQPSLVYIAGYCINFNQASLHYNNNFIYIVP